MLLASYYFSTIKHSNFDCIKEENELQALSQLIHISYNSFKYPTNKKVERKMLGTKR
jgi:hypothetical protein